MSSRLPTRAQTGSDTAAPARPVLTAVVCAVTLAISLAALVRPPLMDLFTRDLAQLRAGQWWRAVTPVLVQPDGWGQLAFNLLGLAVVGAAVERQVRRPAWALVFVVGGPGNVALLGAWTPGLTGGGSSDAVAALLGAFSVLSARRGGRGRWVWTAQLYSVFFAAYLTTLDLAGVVPSIVVGNLSIALFFVARRALTEAAESRLSWACLAVVGLGGALMTVARDGHGTGIVAGMAIASALLLRRRLIAAAGDSRLRRSTVTLGLAVLTVPVVTLLTWVAWARLLGVDLVVNTGGGPSEVGGGAVAAAALGATLLAVVTRQLLCRRRPRDVATVWPAVCLLVTVVSLAGPLTSAVGAPARAALTCLHLVCAATIMTTVPTPVRGARSRAGARRGLETPRTTDGTDATSRVGRVGRVCRVGRVGRGEPVTTTSDNE